MAKINLGRVVLGGLLAGVVLNVGEFILNQPILGEDWDAAMRALNLEPVAGAAVALYVLWSFVMGIAIVWIYAAIRPRFGAGPKTAVIAGLAVWFLVWLMGFGGTMITGMFPAGLVTITILWGIVEVSLAALAGGWLYKEGAVQP